MVHRKCAITTNHTCAIKVLDSNGACPSAPLVILVPPLWICALVTNGALYRSAPLLSCATTMHSMRHCCGKYFFILIFCISTKYITCNTYINSTTYTQQIYRIQQKISLRIKFINYISLRTLQVLISEFVFTLLVSRQPCCIT